MSAAIISVENLGKMYRIRHQQAARYQALRDVIAQRCARSFQGLARRLRPATGAPEQQFPAAIEDFWALKDVSFEVQRGEVLGIIGRNGAGKSTLLKLLSRITEPTTGCIRLKGRVASLLEVGTGFHPELTGRENIFLNGAILGMTRVEIKRKFDEIVAFSEVEKFLDTPVKRYSSGMYVRLAFAVAAHLEPEILIVDEVLAVGDAQFQKKCLGKIQDVSRAGSRTILFVSHNMTAVRALCNRAILLQNGCAVENGPVEKVVNAYLEKTVVNVAECSFPTMEAAPGNEKIRLKSLRLVPDQAVPGAALTVNTPLRVVCEFWNLVPDTNINLSLHLYSVQGDYIFVSRSPSAQLDRGCHQATCFIPGHLLNDGIYSITIFITKDRSALLCPFKDMLTFEIFEDRESDGWNGKWPGLVRPLLDWQYPQSPLPVAAGQISRKDES